MRRKLLTAWLCSVMMLSFIVIVVEIAPTVKASTTIYVDDDYTSEDATHKKTIQAAVNAANTGDTVFVYNGTYVEAVTVNKIINLTGMSRDNTTIDGGKLSNVIKITAHWANVTGFRLKRSSQAATTAGVRLEGVRNCRVENNTMTGNSIGVYINSASYNYIEGNNIFSNTNGGIVGYQPSSNIIKGNNIYSNNDEGIVGYKPSGNIIEGNNIYSNPSYGIYMGIASGNIISDNQIFDNKYEGIWFAQGGSNNNVNNNSITNNAHGVTFSSLSNNVIADNYIWDNQKNGIQISSSSNINILNNNVTMNKDWGICLSSSTNINITRNNLTKDGVYLGGSEVSHFNSHTIPLDNEVNENPLYYYKDRSDEIIDDIIAGELLLANCINLTVRDLEINNSDLGIEMAYCTHCTITKNYLHSNFESGILIIRSSNNNITDHNATSNFRGISIFFSSNNNFTKNNVSNNLDHGIYLSSSSNNDFTKNNVTNNHNDGIYLSSSSNNNFTKNNVTTNHNHGIYLSSSSDNNFIKNNITNNLNHGIYLYSSSDKISNNNVSSNALDGIRLERSHNNNINGNIISNNGNDGISLYNPSGDSSSVSNNNNMYENHILSNNNRGIFIDQYCKYNKAIGNNVTSNTGHGIFNYYAQKNVIEYNNVTDHGIGIYLYGTSTNCKINGNNVFSNNNGIYVNYWASSNQITHNNVFNNTYGIRVRYESNNCIIRANNITNNSYGIYLFSFLSNVKSYHNNLINNTDQAYNELRQYWDNGYPSGGNYWSDYIGVDNYKGPNQDQPGSDGIGDTPYVIDGNSKDNYPLIKPYTHRVFENYTILKKGWNLISIPLIQEEQSLSKVLEMIDGWYDAVRVYDPSDSADPWKHIKIGKPFGNDLNELNETMGFWIHVTKSGESIFLYNGTAPTTSQQIRLYKGWNLVGYPSLTSYNRTDGLNNTEFGTHVNKIMSYNPTTKSWHTMEETEYFQKGVGYWFHTTEDVVWHVPL